MKSFEHKRKSATVEVVGSDIGDQERIIGEEEAHFISQMKDNNERDKTPEELELIHEINKHLRELIDQFGGEYIEIPTNNLHFFSWEDMDPDTKSRILSERPSFTGFEGKFSHENQNVYIIYNEKTKGLKFASTLVHELIHFLAFNSLSILKKEKRNLTIASRRLGFAVRTRDREYYFNDINEALTVELELMFARKYFDKISYTKELEEERRALIEEFKSDPNLPEKDKLEVEDSVWVEKVGGDRYRYMNKSYEGEVDRLRELINDIFQKNLSKFNSSEGVFNVFVRAYLSGRLLPVARLIEKTYGKGSFRELGKDTKAEGSKG